MSFFFETSSTTSPLSALRAGPLGPRFAAPHGTCGAAAQLSRALSLVVVAGTILALLGPPLFDRRRYALGERAGGDVAGDHRAGPGVGAVAELDRRHEHGVRPGAGVGPDLGAVLLAPVVVGGDGAGNDVGAGPD